MRSAVVKEVPASSVLGITSSIELSDELEVPLLIDLSFFLNEFVLKILQLRHVLEVVLLE
eukprot:CAMPEP_0197006378 /NCGR_PEP_ID=MMETSP1380-20130617/34670_1 /TAXON_ID=5936 /ORGANISM="Euplotes crassus, Strain CT5" /LENGTH=59 /DNA_ID=CAMNT_0042425939 /DNA_START=127 /DNA_END=306 /DNA_ORIENTATION=-